MERNVTLIVPTVHHRSALFERVLRYFTHVGLRCPIIVSDHSPTEHIDVVSGIAKRHVDLDITVLRHAPELHFLDRLTLCATAARTPYVHLHADDDFIVRATLEKLVVVMDDQPGIAAAMGINVHAEFHSRDLTVIPKFADRRADAFGRLMAQLESYSSVLYALRRHDEFIASLSYAAQRCPDVQFWQYLETGMAVLEGAVEVIEDLHYVRERHAGKWSARLVHERSRDHFPYLLLSPDLPPRLSAFKRALVDACTARGIEADGEEVDDGLIHLIYRGIATMGLPARRYTEGYDRDFSAIAARFQKRLSDASDATAMTLRDIAAIAQP